MVASEEDDLYGARQIQFGNAHPLGSFVHSAQARRIISGSGYNVELALKASSLPARIGLMTNAWSSSYQAIASPLYFLKMGDTFFSRVSLRSLTMAVPETCGEITPGMSSRAAPMAALAEAPIGVETSPGLKRSNRE